MATQHHLCTMFPPMTPEEYEGLKADIKENGQQSPIMVLKEGDSEGGFLVLDGWHRFRICKELGIAPIIKEWNGECGTPDKFVASTNLHRRHLKTEDRARIAAKLVVGGNVATSQAVGESGEKPRMTLGEAAAVMQVSKRTVQDAVTVEKKATDAEKEAIKQGKTTTHRVASDINAGKPPTQRAAERGQKRQANPRKPKAEAEPELTKPQHAAEPDHSASEEPTTATRSWTDPQQYVPQQVKHVVDEILGLDSLNDPEMVMVMVRDTPEIGEYVEERVYKALDWLDRYCAALTKARHEALAAKVRGDQ